MLAGRLAYFKFIKRRFVSLETSTYLVGVSPPEICEFNFDEKVEFSFL